MSSCGSPLAVAAAIAEAEQAAKKALADALANGGIGGVNPDELAAAVAEAVANAVPPLVANEVPTVLNDILTPQIQQITSNATNQAVLLATQAAVGAVQGTLTNLQTQITNLNSQVGTLQSALTLTKKGIFPYKDKKPKNGTEIVLFKVDFGGTITGFEEQHTGAGTFTPIPAVNGAFNAGDNISVAISSADASTKNLICSLYFTKT